MRKTERKRERGLLLVGIVFRGREREVTLGCVKVTGCPIISAVLCMFEVDYDDANLSLFPGITCNKAFCDYFCDELEMNNSDMKFL